MKKGLKRLFISGAALLMAAPVVANAANTVHADDLKSGDSALSGYSYAQTSGTSGWTVSGTDTSATATGNSYLGVGFIKGFLTLNQVPNFDFGAHNIGSSQSYDLTKIPTTDSAFLPQKLPDQHEPGDTTRGGSRSLVVTDARSDQASVSGYTVALRFSDLQKVHTGADGQPIKDASGNIQFENSAGDPATTGIVTIDDATLTLNAAKTVASGDTWNGFLGSATDGTYFAGGPGVYPGYYTSGSDAFNSGTAISTSDARLADDNAPATKKVLIGQAKDGAVNVFQAAAAADGNPGQGFGTWVYDFSNPGAASLTMPTQKAGLWMANLYWVLTANPAAATPADGTSGLPN